MTNLEAENKQLKQERQTLADGVIRKEAEVQQLKQQLEAAQRENAQLAAMVERFRNCLEHCYDVLAAANAVECGDPTSMLGRMQFEVRYTCDKYGQEQPAALSELLKPTIQALQTCLKNPMALRRMGAIKDSVIDELNRLQKLAGGGK